MCENEGKIDFLSKRIDCSNYINGEMKHRIYLELIKLSKEKT